MLIRRNLNPEQIQFHVSIVQYSKSLVDQYIRDKKLLETLSFRRRSKTIFNFDRDNLSMKNKKLFSRYSLLKS